MSRLLDVALGAAMFGLVPLLSRRDTQERRDRRWARNHPTVIHHERERR